MNEPTHNPLQAVGMVFLIGTIVLGGLGLLAWAEKDINENYPCSSGELVEVDWTIDSREFIDGQGRRSFVYDRVPIYECRLPEAPDASD